MPKKSLKQKILNEVNSKLGFIRTLIYMGHCAKGEKDKNAIKLAKEDYAYLNEVMSSSIDKILETAKGCRPEDEICVACQNDDKDNCFCKDQTGRVYGFNESNAVFDKNWKEQIGE